MLLQISFAGPDWEAASEEVKDFLSKLLDRDYNSRLTASEALQHPWIAMFCSGDVCAAPNNIVPRLPGTSQESLA